MKATRASIQIVAILSACAVLFQNCSPAGPPDLSTTNQSSSIASGGPPIVMGPPITATPTPPPMTQTYSWSVGDWSLCDTLSLQARAVICVNSLGTQVADSNCTDPKPITNQTCTYRAPYNCRATYSGTFCIFSCNNGIRTWQSAAADITQCNANPIGVAGTETGTVLATGRTINRPFTYCVVTRALALIAGSTGDSSCQ